MRRPLGQNPRGDTVCVMPNVVRHPFQGDPWLTRLCHNYIDRIIHCRGDVPFQWVSPIWHPERSAGIPRHVVPRNDRKSCHLMGMPSLHKRTSNCDTVSNAHGDKPVIPRCLLPVSTRYNAFQNSFLVTVSQTDIIICEAGKNKSAWEMFKNCRWLVGLSRLSDCVAMLCVFK